MNRGSGILLHISSLAESYGIGTFGKEAYAFADFLKRSGQTYWQILPIGQTGYGDSPYQPFSIHAGNPYFIDLDVLVSEKLIMHSDIDKLDWGNNQREVDYQKLYNNRYKVLKLAYINRNKYQQDFSKFKDENGYWLKDYSLFMAVKEKNNSQSWLAWEDRAIRLHKPKAVDKYMKELSNEVDYYSFIQFLFYKQFRAFKSYLQSIDIKLIGDLPLYVSMDSSDVWANSKLFQLNYNHKPKRVSGVPPDYFSSTGQLWGNPLYNWKKQKSDNYSWWLKRIESNLNLFDVIRIDHFRGLNSYWSVPYGETNAINGCWKKGPDKDFIDAVNMNFPNAKIIAEDLGLLTEGVNELLKYSGYPGMRILQYGFDKKEEDYHLPHRYIKNCVCYTGTHDNMAIGEWVKEADINSLNYAKSYLGLTAKEGYHMGFIRGGMSSSADLFIAQMQDYLGLSSNCRMNVPGTWENNWKWRLLKGELTDELSDNILAYTDLYDRNR